MQLSSFSLLLLAALLLGFVVENVDTGQCAPYALVILVMAVGPVTVLLSKHGNG